MRLLRSAIVFLFVLSTNTHANVSIEKYCFEAAQLSRAVMTSRQYGDPIENALAVRDRAFEKNKDEQSRLIHTEIILEAYNSPAYSTEPYIKSEINEFAAKNYIACTQGMRLARQHGKLD